MENGVLTGPLRSTDTLILFYRPKCCLKLDDAFLSTSSSSMYSVFRSGDLDVRIREWLCEHSCSYCSQPVPNRFYQSWKEVVVAGANFQLQASSMRYNNEIPLVYPKR